MCVFNTFVATYSRTIKKLTQERFIELCYLVQGIQITKTNSLSLLDKDVEDDEFDDTIKNSWTKEDGVSPKMLFEICKILNISHYAFDVTNNCFLKYVSEITHKNDALVYFAVNGHMYHIKDADAVKSLVSRTLKTEHRIKSSVFEDDDENRFNIYEKYPIIENLPIEKLEEKSKEIKNLEDKSEESKEDSGLIIMYTGKDDIEAEFEQIISLYNIIPIIKNKKSKITFIKPYKEINLYLVIDPNYSDDSQCDYKKVKELCKTFKIEFKNQSFNSMITEARTNFFDTSVKRHKFTKAEREEYFKKNQHCDFCDREFSIKGFQLDHIRALANGETNESSNIQMLCFSCPLDKTNCERTEGYIRLNDSESSFNNETRDVFLSSQYGSYAFVDNYSDKKPRKCSENTVFSLDINKCRRNIMLHNTENYPVFTVMDRIEKYVEKKKMKVGVYFVETDNVFPMRGNRWYHHTMIKYCLEQNIIKTSDIKYQIISSLSLRSNYFIKFIEHISNKLSDDKTLLKLSVNGMIGKFKPKQNENWTSICIQENVNDVFYHS